MDIAETSSGRESEKRLDESSKLEMGKSYSNTTYVPLQMILKYTTISGVGTFQICPVESLSQGAT